VLYCIIYIKRRPDMSMKGMGGLNHKYQLRVHLLHPGHPLFLLPLPIADIRLNLHPYDH
jgi:hypothetical protein